MQMWDVSISIGHLMTHTASRARIFLNTPLLTLTAALILQLHFIMTAYKYSYYEKPFITLKAKGKLIWCWPFHTVSTPRFSPGHRASPTGE